VKVTPLQPANCGFTAAWSEVFRKFEGQPLKRIAVALASRSVRGEAVVTRDGLEGGAIYALSSAIRDAILRNGKATIMVDLLPDVSVTKLRERLSGARGKQSLSNFLRKATHLSPVALGLVREAALPAGRSLSTMDAKDLAGLIKAVPVTLTGVQPIATAISTAGGVSFDELNAQLMLRRRPGLLPAAICCRPRSPPAPLPGTAPQPGCRSGARPKQRRAAHTGQPFHCRTAVRGPD